MDLTNPGDSKLLFIVGEMIFAPSARETAVQDEGGSKKKKRGGGKGASPARVQRPQSDIKTQFGGLKCHLLLLGVWCACACPKGPDVLCACPNSLIFQILN
jgi:hypothetical protein